jgi:hypothetical protein
VKVLSGSADSLGARQDERCLRHIASSLLWQAEMLLYNCSRITNVPSAQTSSIWAIAILDCYYNQFKLREHFGKTPWRAHRPSTQQCGPIVQMGENLSNHLISASVE